MSRLHFSSHALERAEQRLFPGLSPNRVEQALLEAWSRGPAKLRSSKNEERWLIQDPEAILVCAIERGKRTVKTILFKLPDAPETFEEGEDPEPRRRIIVSVAVEYERRGLASHIDVEDKLQHLVDRAVRGHSQTKEFKVLKQETTSRIEFIFSPPEPPAKEE